jgi:hypothetical protein
VAGNSGTGDPWEDAAAATSSKGKQNEKKRDSDSDACDASVMNDMYPLNIHAMQPEPSNGLSRTCMY